MTCRIVEDEEGRRSMLCKRGHDGPFLPQEPAKNEKPGQLIQGRRVMHVSYGKGTVLRASKENISVYFENGGHKEFILEYARSKFEIL